MISLGSLLQKRVQQAGLGRQVEAARIIECAKKELIKIFNENVLTYMQPVIVKDRVLQIRVGSSVAAQELRLRERQIVQVVNQAMGQQVIDHLFSIR